jgi:hypothetical protein
MPFEVAPDLPSDRHRFSAPSGKVCRETESNPEVLGETVAGFDDARFDHHLPVGTSTLAIMARTSSMRLGVSLTNIMFERSSSSALPRLDSRVCLGSIEQLLHCFGLDVVHLEALGLQGLEVADLRLRFELELLLGRDFLARRNQNDVAILAHVETLLLHDDVERLIPGHVLEDQGDRTADRIADDHVHAGELADHLQQAADIDVLEVQRQLLALIAAARALHELVRILDDRLDFDDELGVALIGVVLPEPARE